AWRPFRLDLTHGARLGRAAPGLFEGQERHGAKETGEAGDKKRGSPAIRSGEVAAEKKTERHANGETQHEEGKCLPPLGRGGKIAQKGCGRGGAGSFTETYAQPESEELPVIRGQPRRRREDAPQEHAAGKDLLSRDSVSKTPERDAHQGIKEREGR